MARQSGPRILRWLVPALVALVILGVSSACGGSDDGEDATPGATAQPSAEPTDQAPTQTLDATTSADVAAIEALVHQQSEAFNSKDIDGFVASFSDIYYEALGVTREEASSLVSIFIGVPQVEVTAISAITIDGDGATAEVASNEGVISSLELYTFTREGAGWLILSIDELPVEAASELVELSMFEYGYEFDEGQVGGDFAFNVSNDGTQPHEIELMRLPDGVTPDDVHDRENVPPGVEVIGLFGPLESGETRTLVFADPLASGEYALVCYLTTVTGESNAQLGMVKSLVID